ncbi:MAG: hypothetical protein JXR19_01720 [Bacteroidia bacterium]
MKKKYLKSSGKILLFSVFCLSALFILPNCGDLEEDEDPDPEEEFDGCVSDKIEVTHTIGGSPCPQVAGHINVDVNRGCENADSVAIKNNHNGLTVFFDNNQTSMTLPEDGFAQAEVKFTCAVATSFTHTYTVCLFANGVEIKREDVVVTVTVKS